MFEPSLVHGSVTTLSPFRYWCQKVLPLVYDNSLSYYELLCKVVEYLNETMENVNTIGENTNALYNGYLELVNYVNNYFTNLDVQEEINNKLDAMAESGELEELVTKNILPQIEEIQEHIEEIQEHTNQFTKKYIFIGDSYDQYSGWVNKTAERLGLSNNEYYNLALSGASFKDGRFLSQLQNWVTNNPTEVKNIGTIVCGGGINDSDADGVNVLGTRIQSFMDYVKTNFPSYTKVKLAYFGWALDTSPILADRTAPYRAVACNIYSRCTTWGAEYLTGCESVLHQRDLLDVDGLHPNSEGGNSISYALANALKTGNCSVVKPYGYATINGELKNTITQTIFNDLNIIKFTNFTLELNNTTFSNGEYVEVANVVLPFGNKMTPILVMIPYQNASGNTKALFRVKIENDKMYLALYDFDGGYYYKSDTIARTQNFDFLVTQSAISD